MTSGQRNQPPSASGNAGSEWPKQVDFTQALQNPQISLIGDSVKGGQVVQFAPGRPIMWSGSFAAVYKIAVGGTHSVIRCFTSPVTDQKDRYSRLSDFLRANHLDCLVRFEYLDKGILVRGNPYPLVKMEFVEGENLNKLVARTIKEQQNYPEVLRKVADGWRTLNSELRNLEVAHNDLQHGNVIIQNNLELRLVDYDSFFLPDSAGDSPEGGHANYQHPLRKRSDYNQHVDNFPALVIYLSLLALSFYPHLWDDEKDQQLLFTEQDFKDPSNSECLRELKNSSENRISYLASYLERYCSVPVEHVPNLVRVTSAVNAGQVDPPLALGASRIQNNQPGAAATAPAPSPPSPQTHRPQDARQANPASVTGRRGQRPAATPAAVAPPAQQARPVPPIGIAICSNGHRNDAALIYCDVEQCAAVLHPGSKLCVNWQCRFRHPANARFCPRCGSGLS